MSDLFHEKIPDEFIGKVWNIMLDARQHIFQVLTKRAQRMNKWIRAWTIAAADTKPYGHIWCGVSCETQAYADERIPWLLKTPAAVRFLSVEPLLGPVDLLSFLPIFPLRMPKENMPPSGDWVIVGGESGGPPERALVEHVKIRTGQTLGPTYEWWPKHQALQWVRSLRDQCTAAGVPFFFKGWGGPTPKTGGRLLDGRTWDKAPITNSAYLFQQATLQPLRDRR